MLQGIESYMLWHRPVAGAVCLVAALVGCTPVWRPSLEGVQPAPLQVVIDLTALAPSGGVARQAYRRSDPAQPAVPPQGYERHYQGMTRTEGALAVKTFTGLADYLGPDAPKAADRWKLWPDDPDRKGAAFFLEFDPPLVYLPGSIQAGRESSQQVRLRYYNRDGICTRRGTVRRSVEFEGFETVTAGGVRYADCARLHTRTRIRVDWGPRVDTTEYIWLAPGVGEVRRVQQFSGLAYLVYFSEVQTFELADGSPWAAGAAGAGLSSGEVWARCAVYLDRLLPHPRLGGLAVELAPESAALAGTAPCRLPPE